MCEKWQVFFNYAAMGDLVLLQSMDDKYCTASCSHASGTPSEQQPMADGWVALASGISGLVSQGYNVCFDFEP